MRRFDEQRGLLQSFAKASAIDHRFDSDSETTETANEPGH